MSKSSQQKNARRQRRLEKRERKRAAHEARLEKVRCANCGDLFGLADDPQVVHRPGPCDATPEDVKAMEALLDARSDEYEQAPGGKIACRNCGRMHGEDKQATYFFEAKLFWDGCDMCVEEQSGLFEKLREDRRAAWFGKKLNEVGQTVASKYVPTVAVR